MSLFGTHHTGLPMAKPSSTDQRSTSINCCRTKSLVSECGHMCNPISLPLLFCSRLYRRSLARCMSSTTWGLSYCLCSLVSCSALPPHIRTSCCICTSKIGNRDSTTLLARRLNATGV
ncbi:hypothetical protein BD309DRAFT_520701 [Dichomitus squalens]|uniref:Uncharacterized protein n=1 Tax=Dichomitus squalens TaxID=114155 RepID=A0A4Q9NC38_9APHY|nr:hypothetical protein BD309DRAFT_520701 [Dichomitus squalens]TBU55032.1 hypothetical protein BD310DRAFT_715963 [Dichomitus squalens]